MFTKGNQYARLKGKNKPITNARKIIANIRFSDISSINDLTRDVLRNINEALNSKDENIRYNMTTSIAKYLFSTKKETINVTASFEDFLKEIEKPNNQIENTKFIEINSETNLLNDSLKQ
jgi:hypothetical protein